MKTSAVVRVSLYLRKIYRVSQVDTQKIRAKLMNKLDSKLELAVAIAKGEMKHWRDENGRKHEVTPKQREKWARIAAYAAQVMSSLTRGFDEKQFQQDVKKLQEMVDEIARARPGFPAATTASPEFRETRQSERESNYPLHVCPVPNLRSGK